MPQNRMPKLHLSVYPALDEVEPFTVEVMCLVQASQPLLHDTPVTIGAVGTKYRFTVTLHAGKKPPSVRIPHVFPAYVRFFRAFYGEHMGEYNRETQSDVAELHYSGAPEHQESMDDATHSFCDELLEDEPCVPLSSPQPRLLSVERALVTPVVSPTLEYRFTATVYPHTKGVPVVFTATFKDGTVKRAPEVQRTNSHGEVAPVKVVVLPEDRFLRLEVRILNSNVEPFVDYLFNLKGKLIEDTIDHVLRKE